MIVSGGENVHPLEIEEWLVRHPGVDEAAVVGEADERLGQRVVAYVVGAAEADAGGARRALPRLADARALQAPARLPFRRRAAEERVGQAPAPHAAHDGGNHMTEYDGFRVARENDRGVATITLDVPEKFNRVSMGARDELARVFGELGGDDAVRVVVLRGAGDKAFTAGGDVGMFMERDAETLSHLHVNVAAPERCPKPVIAQLHGYCFGVGLELALACDFRVASDDAQLALPELTLGMIPGSGGASRLVKMIGVSRTKDVVMRGRRVPAAEAQAWGLLCEVVPRDELGAAVASLADELAARPALALRTAKRVIGTAQDAPLSVAMELGGPRLRAAARHARLRRGRLGVRREAEAAVRGPVSGESALRGRIGLLVAVALAALTLRPQLVGLGPVLPRAQDALGVSHSVASLLSAHPRDRHGRLRARGGAARRARRARSAPSRSRSR